MRYQKMYAQPWGRSRLRYVDDGRPFSQHIVSSSTGCSDLQYFEELYHYYMTGKACQLCHPNAKYVFQALKRAGVKTTVVSNFDTRLQPLLQALKCDRWFDAVAMSTEVAAKKPNPTIFLKACELLGVKPEEAVHIGDDRRNDLWGARDVGCDAWLWGSDVYSFKELSASASVPTSSPHYRRDNSAPIYFVQSVKEIMKIVQEAWTSPSSTPMSGFGWEEEDEQEDRKKPEEEQEEEEDGDDEYDKQVKEIRASGEFQISCSDGVALA